MVYPFCAFLCVILQIGVLLTIPKCGRGLRVQVTFLTLQTVINKLVS